MRTDLPQGSLDKTVRYEMLDVWRGLVSLLVVLEHVGVCLWDGASKAEGWEGQVRRLINVVLNWNLGSTFFFVMSGYCIASSLNGARRRGSTPVEFLSRRLWRIYPTYWAALLLFVGVVVALDNFGLRKLHDNGYSLQIASLSEMNGAQWLGNLTLTETWRPLVGGGMPTVFTRVAWSLCYQEQFYMVCVLALWLFPSRLDRALGIATVLIVAYHLITIDVGAIHRIEGTFPIYWHLFAIGLAVYWRLNCSTTATARRRVDIGLAALIVVGFALANVSIIAAAGFGLLLIGLFRWDQASAGIAWLTPIRVCGRSSFSIYLTHLPVTTIANFLLIQAGLTAYWSRALVVLPIVTVASILMGCAFHQVVEKRFMGYMPGTKTSKSKRMSAPHKEPNSFQALPA